MCDSCPRSTYHLNPLPKPTLDSPVFEICRQQLPDKLPAVFIAAQRKNPRAATTRFLTGPSRGFADGGGRIRHFPNLPQAEPVRWLSVR